MSIDVTRESSLRASHYYGLFSRNFPAKDPKKGERVTSFSEDATCNISEVQIRELGVQIKDRS